MLSKANFTEQNRFYFVAKRHININYVSFLLFAIVATGSCAKEPMVFKSSNSPNSNFAYGKTGLSLGSEYHEEKKKKTNSKKKKEFKDQLR